MKVQDPSFVCRGCGNVVSTNMYRAAEQGHAISPVSPILLKVMCPSQNFNGKNRKIAGGK
jgi:hypothetical protein